MVGKRRSVVDENRTKSSVGNGRKKKKRIISATKADFSCPGSNNKKQTSLTSFWGKQQHLVGTKNKTKSATTQHPTTESTHRLLLIVTPSSKLEQKKIRVHSDDEELNCRQNDTNDGTRNKENGDKEIENMNKEGIEYISTEAFDAKKSLDSTLKMDASITFTLSKTTLAPNKMKSNEILRIDVNDNHETKEPKEIESQSDFENEDVRTNSSPPSLKSNKGKDEPKSLSHDLSEYEKLRLRNIERNNTRLASLGLLTTTSNTSTSGGGRTSRRRPPNKKPAIHERTRQQPLRRSSRNRDAKTELPASSEGNIDPNSTTIRVAKTEASAIEEEERYTVSPLLQYGMNRHQSDEKCNSNLSLKSVKAPSIDAVESDNNIDSSTATFSSNTCLAVTGPRFLPPKGLSAIYSLQFWTNNSDETSSKNGRRKSSNWLVGAGKAGMIALWDTNNKEVICTANDTKDHAFVNPVLSWKAHSGRWIADAIFLSGPNINAITETIPSVDAPSRLVTAGNDGTVCLWDLSTVSSSTRAPKLLYRTGKEYHSSGIFCMDVLSSSMNRNSSEVMICSGSKDKSIVVSSLESLISNNTTTKPTWRSRFHNAKVGAVKMQSSTSYLLASASDDGIVALHDFRTNGLGSSSSSLVSKLENAHDRPHSVVWDPCNEFILVTAGLDPIVKVWDHRNLVEPIASLEGHVPTFTGRIRKIHRPIFFGLDSKSTNNARWSSSHACPFLLTGGQGSSFVSMYQMGYNQIKNDDMLPIVSQPSTLFSRGKLPIDCGESGSIAVNGKQVAVAVDQGEIIILEPSRRVQVQ